MSYIAGNDYDKIPKGYCRCVNPKCGVFVKGPRTTTCPACQTAIPKKSNGKPGRPAKVKTPAIAVVAEPVGPVAIPDPYTFKVDAFTDQYTHEKRVISRRATGAVLVRKASRKVLEYISKLPDVSSRIVVQDANFQTFAALAN